MLILYLGWGGGCINRNQVNLNSLGCFLLPSPNPISSLQGSKGGTSGTTIQIQACRPYQVSGSKEKTQEEPSRQALR